MKSYSVKAIALYLSVRA